MCTHFFNDLETGASHRINTKNKNRQSICGIKRAYQMPPL